MTKKYKNFKYYLRENGKLLVKIAGFSAVFSFLFYTYFLGHTIYSVVDRKAVEHATDVLASEVSVMELRYLEGVGSIDREFALSRGFSEPVHTYYTNQNILLSFRDDVR
jgi:hypothetical protein